MTVPDPRLGNVDWLDNWTLGSGLRFELIGEATQQVFLCQAEVSAAELAEFEPPAGFRHALAGAAVADMAYFDRSPGADEPGQLDTVELGGRRFSYVARPAGFEALASGAVDMTIEKHHALLHRAGRTLDLLDFGNGTVATPAWASPDPSATVTAAMLDRGWKLRRIELTDDLIVTIPNPARVIVLDTAFGFHGPVDEALVALVSKELSTP